MDKARELLANALHEPNFEPLRRNGIYLRVVWYIRLLMRISTFFGKHEYSQRLFIKYLKIK